MVKDTQKTALLVMDVQPGIVDRYDDKDQYVAFANEAILAARQNDMPVIYVVVGFRPGFPEVSQQNRMFSTIKERADNFVQPQPVFELTPDDIVVQKRRVSAFSGSDLEVILRLSLIHI